MTFDLVSEYLLALSAIHSPNLLGISWNGYSFTSVKHVEDFLRFVQGQGHVLSSYPYVTFQQVNKFPCNEFDNVNSGMVAGSTPPPIVVKQENS